MDKKRDYPGAPIDDGKDFDMWNPKVLEALGFGQEKEEPLPVLTYTPTTQEHLKAMALISQGLGQRSVPRNQFGQPKVDCSCLFEQVCQICDSKSGPWVFKNGMPNNDRRFNRYQEELLRNKLETMSGPEKETGSGEVITVTCNQAAGGSDEVEKL